MRRTPHMAAFHSGKVGFGRFEDRGKTPVEGSGGESEDLRRKFAAVAAALSLASIGAVVALDGSDVTTGGPATTAPTVGVISIGAAPAAATATTVAEAAAPAASLRSYSCRSASSRCSSSR